MDEDTIPNEPHQTTPQASEDILKLLSQMRAEDHLLDDQGSYLIGSRDKHKI